MCRDEGVTELPVSVEEDLLASSRRCHLISVLDTHGETSLLDLAASLRAREQDVEPGEVSRVEIERLRTELLAEHLPKLTATGIVEFDSVVGKVGLREPAIVPQAVEALEGEDAVD